jgi:predicted extracellular nuclease
MRTSAAIGLFVFSSVLAGSAQAQVVISQIYGAGGNSGATYTNDYIELFNRGAVAASLNGWSVQSAATTGTNWSRINLGNTTLQPGQYYLVQAAGGANGAPLPVTPDIFSTSINMSGTIGKVALVNNTTTITAGTSCPTRLYRLWNGNQLLGNQSQRDAERHDRRVPGRRRLRARR